MNKRFAIALSVLFVLSTGSLSQTDAGRYVAPDGMFSFSIPAGWVLREIPGRKYKVAFGQPIGDFAPNINIVDESFSGALDAYVDGNLKVMPQAYERLGYQNFKVLSREIFTTATKQTGVRVITQTEVNGRALRQTFFFFNAKDGRKLVVTCTTLAAAGEDFDVLFEKSLKTFLSENTASNSSLDASGGSVFRIMTGPAMH